MRVISILPSLITVLQILITLQVVQPQPQEVTTGGDSTDIKVTTTRGLVIDAGSGGSRLHIYNWQPRIFKSIPPDLSFPSTDEQWTARMAPGIAELKDDPQKVKEHLAPLIDFAIRNLYGYEDSFKDYPIYFKATGGMRELNVQDREAIMKMVRLTLSDKSFCPFFFRDDMARVISGEEEAIYSWAGINFLMGILLPESRGLGQAGGEGTYGTLDLGGASCQIAFFVANQDISENLFRLQIGGQKHWNVYTKSFLTFGINSARERHMLAMADTVVNKGGGGSGSVVDYCLHSGYSEKNGGSGPKPGDVTIQGPSSASDDQFDKCTALLRPLMNKDIGAFCNQVYNGECSIGGAYQPQLPDNGKFIGTSSYLYPWEILRLSGSANLMEYKTRAQRICSLSYSGVQSYHDANRLVDTDSKLEELLPYFCFLVSYGYVLLIDGFGFQTNSTLTVLDEVNGNKVGWPLGAILYEINSLPWELVTPDRQPWGKLFLAAVTGLFFGAVASFLLSKELHTNRSIFVLSQSASDLEDYEEYDDDGEEGDVDGEYEGAELDGNERASDGSGSASASRNGSTSDLSTSASPNRGGSIIRRINSRVPFSQDGAEVGWEGDPSYQDSQRSGEGDVEEPGGHRGRGRGRGHRGAGAGWFNWLLNPFGNRPAPAAVPEYSEIN